MLLECLDEQAARRPALEDFIARMIKVVNELKAEAKAEQAARASAAAAELEVGSDEDTDDVRH